MPRLTIEVSALPMKSARTATYQDLSSSKMVNPWITMHAIAMYQTLASHRSIVPSTASSRDPGSIFATSSLDSHPARPPPAPTHGPTNPAPRPRRFRRLAPAAWSEIVDDRVVEGGTRRRRIFRLRGSPASDPPSRLARSASSRLAVNSRSSIMRSVRRCPAPSSPPSRRDPRRLSCGEQLPSRVTSRVACASPRSLRCVRTAVRRSPTRSPCREPAARGCSRRFRPGSRPGPGFDASAPRDGTLRSAIAGSGSQGSTLRSCDSTSGSSTAKTRAHPTGLVELMSSGRGMGMTSVVIAPCRSSASVMDGIVRPRRATRGCNPPGARGRERETGRPSPPGSRRHIAFGSASCCHRRRSP